ncbi:SEC14-like protein 4 isoform X2 [Folsomia candida]|uniref:SEC14-like protein 4 isoform X2 n=1 Tax=Folsomia candida TaxID=158441 RepID=UPI0016052945|nr:SEC14-like protein 4 isoform X2 [Folsomia candida]
MPKHFVRADLLLIFGFRIKFHYSFIRSQDTKSRTTFSELFIPSVCHSSAILLENLAIFLQTLILSTMTLVLLDEEVSVFEEFRTLTVDLNVDETTRLRFLRARDLNVKRGEEMLRRSVEWRESNEIETISKWEIPSEILKEFRMYFTGLDEQGYPVYLIPLGRWDGRKILGKGLKEESIKFMYRTLETIMAACRDLGVTKFSVIVDNDGLTLWKCAHWDSIESSIRVIKDFESNYPETLVNAYLVNTPTVFWQAFKFIKPVLAGNTLAKINIFDSDKKKWSAALLERIPKDALPNEYGGDAKAFDIHLA